MRFSSPFWAAAALSLISCGGNSEESQASSPVEASSPLRSEARLLRNANPVRGQYIVVLKPGSSQGADIQDAARELTGRYRGQLHRIFHHVLRGFVVSMSEAQAEQLARDPSVAYVEEDGWAYPNASQPNATWGIDRVDQRDLPLSTTYQYNTTGSGVHAYVIDTGIRATHSEFGGRVSLDYSAVSDGNGASDCNGHGTHVAGTIGGATWGVAKDVRLHSVRVFGCSGGAAWSTVIGAVDWVTANHIKPAVVNMSLGGGANQAMDDAVANSINAGVVYAIAAGNGYGADACGYSPARTPAALTVGSTDSNDSRSSFSNVGSCIDLFAPGGGITSAWWSSDTATNTISGTSMATPHVAGAAALYLGVNPNATPAQVASALVDNSTLNLVVNPGAGSANRLLYSAFIGGGGGATVCKGSTPAGVGWQQYSDEGIYLDVDTASCGFSSTPLYFTSLGGVTWHWMAKGATSIYSETPSGFRVYIYYPGMTPTLANQLGWHLNWQATPDNLRQPSLCTGQTAAGATGWQYYTDEGIYLDVDTSGCGNSMTPLYLTSIGGWGGHWMAKGATSIYSPTPTGFRVYLYYPGMTPQLANQLGWHLKWQATPDNLRQADTCTGRTAAGATGWQYYTDEGIYLDVDTSGCSLSSQPVTSIGGWGWHWMGTGATSIYSPTPTGFRVYLYYPGMTPQLANQLGWHLNWSKR
ncbi:MAG TPA: S8 family peptidase [Myxococcaceae bacterium]|nr:S8 family peptidase [Myxococcaceae bacterium]